MNAKTCLRMFLIIYSVSVSLASIIFMGLVFYSEGALGKGMTYIEPNRGIALTELVICVLGFATTLGLFVWMMEK